MLLLCSELCFAAETHELDDPCCMLSLVWTRKHMNSITTVVHQISSIESQEFLSHKLHGGVEANTSGDVLQIVDSSESYFHMTTE